MADHGLAFSDGMTLETPGSITVVGGGPVGVEAALYGRYLGYDLVLIEQDSIGCSMLERSDQPLPMLPDRCLSTLAVSALKAQSGDNEFVLPITFGDWVNRGLVPLTQSDLLQGRVRTSLAVTSIDAVPVATDEGNHDHNVDGAAADAADVDIPHDFRLLLAGDDGQTEEHIAEAVILAVGDSPELDMKVPGCADYLFRIGGAQTGDDEQALHQARQEIVAVFATLVGRAGLDLYRPQRL